MTAVRVGLARERERLDREHGRVREALRRTIAEGRVRSRRAEMSARDQSSDGLAFGENVEGLTMPQLPYQLPSGLWAVLIHSIARVDASRISFRR